MGQKKSTSRKDYKNCFEVMAAVSNRYPELRESLNPGLEKLNSLLYGSAPLSVKRINELSNTIPVLIEAVKQDPTLYGAIMPAVIGIAKNLHTEQLKVIMSCPFDGKRYKAISKAISIAVWLK